MAPSARQQAGTARRWTLPALCLLLALAFAALGVWQMERRTWKLELIARTEDRVHAAPSAVPPRDAWPTVSRDHDEYRRVRVRGVLDHRAETLVQAVTDLGPGWWVMTPLRTTDGVVLINRGFVPFERANRVARAAGLPPGEVAITGLMRLSEPAGAFLRANDPGANRWFSRDVPAIARARGLSGAAPFFVDADAAPNAGGYPVGGLTTVTFRNTHLVYALTWFALSGLALAGAYIGWRPRPDVGRAQLR